MRLEVGEARARFSAARVARLATASTDAQPHVVPIVFAVAGDVIYTAVDAKPKASRALRRMANVAANPQVAVLVDHYDDDWRQLWWVRADGRGRVVDEPEAAEALELLAERYPVYREQPPPGPVLGVQVVRWVGWQFSPHPGGNG